MRNRGHCTIPSRRRRGHIRGGSKRFEVQEIIRYLQQVAEEEVSTADLYSWHSMRRIRQVGVLSQIVKNGRAREQERGRCGSENGCKEEPSASVAQARFGPPSSRRPPKPLRHEPEITKCQKAGVALRRSRKCQCRNRSIKTKSPCSILQWAVI